MSNITVIYTGNDTVLEVAALRNGLTGEALNSADVAVTLNDALGNPVDDVSWPLSLLYVADSAGMYRVTLPYSLPLQPNARYTAAIAVNGGPGLVANWELECVARQRA